MKTTAAQPLRVIRHGLHAISLVALVMLSGCGQKGPLYYAPAQGTETAGLPTADDNTAEDAEQAGDAATTSPPRSQP